MSQTVGDLRKMIDGLDDATPINVVLDNDDSEDVVEVWSVLIPSKDGKSLSIHVELIFENNLDEDDENYEQGDEL